MPTERDQFAGVCFGAFDKVASRHVVDAAKPVRAECRPVLDRAAPDARIGQLAGVAGMHRLEYLSQRRPIRCDTVSFRGLRIEWRIVTQCFPQPAHTVRVVRAAEQDLDHRACGKVLAQVGIDLGCCRLDVLQHFFQQRIVVVGQGFDQLVQRLLFRGRHFGGDLNQLGRLALAVSVGAFADHIDITGDGFAVPDRHLTQYQRRTGERLQGGQRVGHAAFQCFDLVDEDHVRHAKVGELFQHRGHRERAGRRWLADHHSEIDHGQRGGDLVGEFDRPGAVEDRPAIAEVLAMAKAELGGAGPVTGIRRSLHGCAGGFHQGVEQRGFAAAVRPDQCHRAWTSAVWGS